MIYFGPPAAQYSTQKLWRVASHSLFVAAPGGCGWYYLRSESNHLAHVRHCQKLVGERQHSQEIGIDWLILRSKAGHEMKSKGGMVALHRHVNVVESG